MIAPSASPTDQMTVSAPGEFVVIAILKGTLFWKTRRPSVVGVSALINPLVVPPAVCIGVLHEIAGLTGVGVVDVGVDVEAVGVVDVVGEVEGVMVTDDVVVVGAVVTGALAAVRLTQHALR